MLTSSSNQNITRFIEVKSTGTISWAETRLKLYTVICQLYYACLFEPCYIRLALRKSVPRACVNAITVSFLHGFACYKYILPPQ